MAEPLVNQFGLSVPTRIAAALASTGVRKGESPFDTQGFMREVRKRYDTLNLMQRAIHIADVLQRFLPAEYPAALRKLLASLDTSQPTTDGSLASFFYLPHTLFVARHGLDHFELSMQAQYVLTQYFTAEFSIRPFIERYPAQSFALLKRWASDDNMHVRRLVSEGTRPRLPWASRLKALQRDPTPAIALLELLKDDPELYVRRSVANHLNDIGKDHPELLLQIAQRWWHDPQQSARVVANRQWIIRHALRVMIKRGDAQALRLLGYGSKAAVVVREVSLSSHQPRIGERLTVQFTLHNPQARTLASTQSLMVDLRVHYVKANGATQPKVFKLKALQLGADESVTIRKTLSLMQMTTRKHYPGTHQIEVLINGQPTPLAEFQLLAARWTE